MLSILFSKIDLSRTTQRPSLFISPKAEKNTSPEDLQRIIACIEETHQVIKTTSALPGFEGNANRVEESRREVNLFIYRSLACRNKQIRDIFLLRTLVVAIKAQGTGNCYEFAFYASSILSKAMRVEIFRVKDKSAQGNHVFLVINRDPESSIDDPELWEEKTLIVDPYLRKIYSASEIAQFLQSCVYDQEFGTVVYSSYNSEIHFFDNNLIEELLMDWRRILESGVSKKNSEDADTVTTPSIKQPPNVP